MLRQGLSASLAPVDDQVPVSSEEAVDAMTMAGSQEAYEVGMPTGASLLPSCSWHRAPAPAVM